MDRSHKQWIATAIAYLAVYASVAVVSAHAEGTPDDLQTQLRELQQALNDAELTNAAVRTELNEARNAYYNDNWINEERAASVMELVNDVLADSNQRVNLYGDGSMNVVVTK